MDEPNEERGAHVLLVVKTLSLLRDVLPSHRIDFIPLIETEPGDEPEIPARLSAIAEGSMVTLTKVPRTMNDFVRQSGCAKIVYVPDYEKLSDQDRSRLHNFMDRHDEHSSLIVASCPLYALDLIAMDVRDETPN